jgi:hypothetical protein
VNLNFERHQVVDHAPDPPTELSSPPDCAHDPCSSLFDPCSSLFVMQLEISVHGFDRENHNLIDD